MKEFIDKTETSEGTRINRKNLMAIQGFVSKDFSFNEDGSITETNEFGEKLTTVFNDEGTITEIFEGEKIITKITTINNGVTEVIE